MWIGFSEEDAIRYSPKAQKSAPRPSGILCQRVEDNAFHLGTGVVFGAFAEDVI